MPVGSEEPDKLKSLLQKSEREQGTSGPPLRRSAIFIASKPSPFGSVRKSGKAILLDSNEGRSSEQSRVTELLRAINIALLRSEERTAERCKSFEQIPLRESLVYFCKSL